MLVIVEGPRWPGERKGSRCEYVPGYQCLVQQLPSMPVLHAHDIVSPIIRATLRRATARPFHEAPER